MVRVGEISRRAWPSPPARLDVDAVGAVGYGRRLPLSSKSLGLKNRKHKQVRQIQVQEVHLLRQIVSCARCGAPMHLRSERKETREYVCRNVRLDGGQCDLPRIRADILEAAVLLRLQTFAGDLEEWIAERQDARQEHRRLLQQNVVRSRFQSEQVERRIERAQQRYDRALDAADHERVSAVEEELTRLREQASRHRENLAQAKRLVQEWSAEPDLEAARARLEDVLKPIAGKIDAAEGRDAVRAAVRAALASVQVDVHGDELEVDIRVRSEDLPDVLIRTPVDAPISESVRPQLSGGRMVYVHPVLEQVSRHE
jgi:Recombinase zinc beta ribbon domain